MQSVSRTQRDPRLDVLRGMALLMIFVDHIPGDVLSLLTMHNFSFCDAAELFVLISGMSSMLAYGRAFDRHGPAVGFNRLLRRWIRLYVFQIALVLATLCVVFLWGKYLHVGSKLMQPFLDDPASGILQSLALHAVPAYLDILPLYLVLLGVFPIVYVGLRTNIWLTLAASAAVWIAANSLPWLNIPNWAYGGDWPFNPFAWQFLFTIGAALGARLMAGEVLLPRVKAVAALSVAYLIFALLENFPWAAWHLADLRPFTVATPSKADLAPLRLADILALAYLLFSSANFALLIGRRAFDVFALLGRHSLEVFAIGCVAALFGRLLFRTYGPDVLCQFVANALGFIAMWLVAYQLEGNTAREMRNREAVASGTRYRK
jgi:hypothetical protein